MKKILTDGLSLVAVAVGIKHIVLADSIWEYVFFVLLTILNSGFLIKSLKTQNYGTRSGLH